MREVVTLHFGQAGIQMGNAIWELLCLEHGINEKGILHEEPRDVECIETFFSVSHNGNFVPRTLFIDLEPSVIDEVRSNSYRTLFHPNRLISGPEDAANNFARGFFTVGKLIMNSINYEIRKLMESCGNCHGLIIFRGLGGGTGSGLTSAIFDNLAEYPKTYKLEMPIYPSATLCTSTVEPYNSLLAQHFCMEDIDVGLLFDNEAIFDVCVRSLKQESATYSLINRLIAQVCSNLTVSIRFENTISSDLTVLQNNLVPYPRIHFPLCSYAPFIPESQNKHTSIAVSEITKSVFDPETQLLKVDNSFGKMMSCALNYRGDISPYHVYLSLMEIKSMRNLEFVDWCPTGFKVGINLCPPVVVPDSCLVKTRRNVTLLTNTSAIGQAWQRLTHKFYMLYSKKSFVHWYIGEGMEECEFTESLYNITSLVKDYEECVLDTKTENLTSTKTGDTEVSNVDSQLKKSNKRPPSRQNLVEKNKGVTGTPLSVEQNQLKGITVTPLISEKNQLKVSAAIPIKDVVMPGDCIHFETENNDIENIKKNSTTTSSTSDQVEKKEIVVENLNEEKDEEYEEIITNETETEETEETQETEEEIQPEEAEMQTKAPVSLQKEMQAEMPSAIAKEAKEEYEEQLDVELHETEESETTNLDEMVNDENLHVDYESIEQNYDIGVDDNNIKNDFINEGSVGSYEHIDADEKEIEKNYDIGVDDNNIKNDFINETSVGSYENIDAEEKDNARNVSVGNISEEAVSNSIEEFVLHNENVGYDERYDGYDYNFSSKDESLGIDPREPGNSLIENEVFDNVQSDAEVYNYVQNDVDVYAEEIENFTDDNLQSDAEGQEGSYQVELSDADIGEPRSEDYDS